MSLQGLASHYMGKYGMNDGSMLHKEAVRMQQICFQHTASSKKEARKEARNE